MRVIIIAAVVLLFVVSFLYAHTQEDLEFAQKIFARGWFDLAEKIAKAIYDEGSNTKDLRGWAAKLHFAILNQKGKTTGDQTLVKMAEGLFERYGREFPDHDAWGPAARFEGLDRKLQAAQDVVKKADPEVEADPQKRKELSDAALKVFEEIAQEWETLIRQFRLQVAKWPPKHEWGIWREREKPSMEEQKRLLDAVFYRDLAEYKYATSLIYYAKVVDKEKRKALLEKGIKKFKRFTDGEPEFEGDKDPPCRGEEGPQDPQPRTTYPILESLSYIGLGQCYQELGDYEKAIENFDLDLEAEIPPGSEESEDDILKVVDVRLQAFFLEALSYNKMQKYEDAIKILDRMFDNSGKEIHPNRPEIMEYWRKKGKESVALLPNVYEHPYGKMAAMQKAEALAALGRHQEGIGIVWEIFKREAKQRIMGAQNPFEVEAAKTMASIAEKLPQVEFEVGPAYGVAKGLEYKGEFEKAVEAYKKALSAKGSEEDKRVYIPEALWELATNLMQQKKFSDAAPYLIELCEKHRGFRNIAKVPPLLRQCAEKARRAGTIDLAKVSEWKKIADEANPEGSNLSLLDDNLRDASEAEAKKDYERAKELYESIRKTYTEKDPGTGRDIYLPYPRYALARAGLGAAYYALALVEKGHKNQQEYDELISLSTTILEETLNLSAELQDDRANGKARFYLASIYLEDSVPKEKKQEYAAKALDYLKAFDDQLKGKKGLESYAPEVLINQATANFILGDYEKMHERILALEKEHKGTPYHLRYAIQFYETIKKVGEQVEAGSAEAAKPFFEKAAYYVYSWYKNQDPNKVTPKDTLWAGKALCDVRGYEKGVEVLKQYFDMIPKKEERNEEQRKAADTAKVLLAECYYGMGNYKDAATLFDLMRHETQCDQITKGTCDYEGTPEIGEPADFDRALGECPKCKRGKLKRKNDNVLEIQEGAAKSYLALYEHSKPKDMVALDRALDVYQRIHNMISPLIEREDEKEKMGSELREQMLRKLWEVKYIIMTIWRERRQQTLVISEIDGTMLWVGEGNWDKIVPVEPWRTKIRELYELCKKEVEGTGK
jgi:tetratricopeptide (TPR) repeat protein